MPTGTVVDAASLFGENPEQVAAGQVPRRRVVPAADLFTPTPFEDTGGLASDAVTGFVKGRGKTAVGIAELLSRMFDAAGSFRGTATDIEEMKRAMTDPTAFDEVQAGLEPTTGAQKAGNFLGEMAEFGAASAVKGPAVVEKALSKVPALRGVVRAGAETAAVRSAQEGELPSPREVGLGAAAGGIGQGIGRAIKALGRKAFEHAPETAAKIFPTPKGEFKQKKTMDALSEILQQNEMPVGNIDEIANALKARTSRLKGTMDEQQAGVSFHTEDIRPLYDSLLDEIDRRSAQGIRGSTPYDPQETKRLQELATELVDLARVHRSRLIPREDLEKKLDAWQKVYAQNLDTPGTARAMTKTGADMLLDFLNTTDPERAAATGPFSRSLSLEKGARKAAAKAPFQQATGIGEAGAVRTGVGALAGGTVGGLAGGPMGATAGATLGALTTPMIVRFLRSPLFLSLSAREQNRVGRFLMNQNPDNARAAFAALGIQLAPEGAEE